MQRAPRHRRFGHSRRAQYSLFAGYVVAIAGLILGMGALILSRVDPNGFQAVRGLVLDATAPLTVAGRGAIGGIAGARDAIGAYIDAGRQNAAMKAELAAARRELAAYRVTAFENRRLRGLLRVGEPGTERVGVGRIVGSTASSARRIAIVTLGSTAGARTGQPVRAAEGLIGRVLEVGHFASRVLLVTDESQIVPARIVRDGTPALLAGRGDGLLELRALAAGSAPFRRGDLIATSGAGGLYRPDVPVAVVVEVERDVAVARPLADAARADFVIVEQPYLPPLPPPATRPLAP